MLKKLVYINFKYFAVIVIEKKHLKSIILIFNTTPEKFTMLRCNLLFIFVLLTFKN